MSNANGAIGWDDEVSSADAGNNEERDEFVVLPPGTYACTVMKVERGSFKGSAKLPPCNKVKVGVVLDGGPAGRGWANHNFFMHTSCLWKIYQFFEALGLRKKGDSTAGRIPWEKVEKGMTACCKVKTREWDGKQYNEIEGWSSADAQPEEPEDSDY